MSTAQALITVEEFWEMDFDGPVELVRGEVVELPRPNTWHGYVCASVSHLLKTWNEDDQFGYVISNGSGVLTERDPDTLRGPDVCFIRHERLPGGELPERWIEVPPDLAVEVLFPSDSWNDLWEKIHEYFAPGVRDVWVIDPRQRTLQALGPGAGPRTYDDGQTIETADVLPGFSCAISRMLPPTRQKEANDAHP